MNNTLTRITILFALCLTLVAGCAENVPTEPPANAGSVFQRSTSEVQDAARNGLTRLGFAITADSEGYLEAVHLKPGETVEENKSELVGIWIKPKGTGTLLLIDTAKRPSGVAKQREWEERLLREISQELQ